MARSKSDKSGLRLEILGLFLFVLTAFTVISLFSYSPADESANLIGGSQQNLAGSVGAFLADQLFQVMGFLAYLIPVPVFLLALNCFLPTDRCIRGIRFAGALLALLFFSALLALIAPQPLALGKFNHLLLGGVLGGWLSTGLKIYFNTWGAYLIVVAAFLISLMLITDLSLRQLFTAVYNLFARISQAVQNLFPPTLKIEGASDPTVKPEKKTERPSAPLPKILTGKTEPETKEVKEEIEKPPPVINSPVAAPAVILPKKEQENQEELLLDSQMSPLSGSFRLPDLSLLEAPKPVSLEEVRQGVLDKSNTIESKLRDFGVDGRIVQVHLGPVITRYEFEPAPGIKVNRIVNLSDDLALALKAVSVRIVAPIPGKAVVGIEVPNLKRQVIYLREVLAADKFQSAASCLSLALGKDTEGTPYVTNLAQMPHLLIAGATGSGKSVALNTVICSILYKATPNEVRFVMVDPKMLELGIYNGIPHLLGPVVTNPKKAAAVLHWATREMENRYQMLADAGVRNIDQYNNYVAEFPARHPDAEPPQPLPFIVIIIDEFADLMLMAAKDIETLITRLAQMARAVGIHLIVATQRPSVDVITGVIKANFPCRISFRVASKIDSRTILDVNGAEKLLGKGDMLFIPPHTSLQERIHGAMVSENEVKAIVEFLKEQAPVAENQPWQTSSEYQDLILSEDNREGADAVFDEYDEFYDEAVDLVIKTGQASISNIQRRFRIGYNRAARMVEVMERDGVVGPSVAGKPRKVLLKSAEGEQ
ncbi:MAG: DNA translocase FtsK 4TM domain-containing protein [Candidatus Schekmanbacteria bacterium]|nr:DNA translocase FtsK 4TM domain-containing protein [Candidatus Schekmanbacteria bacterium]